MELVTQSNDVWYINELEQQEKKRVKILEEQMQARKKVERMKLMAEDKSTEGGN